MHHVHLWQMQEHEVALDCHVVLEDHNCSHISEVKQVAKDRRAEGFGITHSNLEIETADASHEGAALFGYNEASAPWRRQVMADAPVTRR